MGQLSQLLVLVPKILLIQTNGSLLKISLQVQTHVILLLLMMDLIPPKMFMFLQPEMVMMVFQLATLQLPQLVSPTPLLLDVFLQPLEQTLPPLIFTLDILKVPSVIVLLAMFPHLDHPSGCGFIGLVVVVIVVVILAAVGGFLYMKK